MSKYFVTAIGNAIIDVLALVKDDFLKEKKLEKGSMSLIDQNNVLKLADLKYEKIVPGGSAANTVVAVSAFGVKNAFIGNVGSGQYGDMFDEDLKKNGVDFYCKNKTEFGSTARSFVLITPDSERTMCTFLGKAAHISNEIHEDVITNSEFLYLEGYLWDQAETIQALKKAIIMARNNNVKIAYTLSDSFCVQRHKQDMLKLVNKIDVLFANEAEIKELTSSSEIKGDKIKQLAKNNNHLTIVITRHDKDAIVFDAKTNNFYKIPAQKVKNVVDVTGAGDAFAAGFLYGQYHQLSKEDSAKIGHLFASNIIQKIGGRFDEEQISKITQILQAESLNVG